MTASEYVTPTEAGATATLPDTLVLPVDDITPYWRNPRRIPQDAVDAVATSIKRYGYQQPIVVDAQHVVIVGHTRLQAVRQLGWTEVPVYVATLPEAKAKEYRLIDNKTGEMTSWDHSSLVLELREFEQALLETFFPDVDLEIGAINDANDVTNRQVEEATAKIGKVATADPTATLTTEIVCPACFHSFEVRTRSLPGLSYSDLWELVDARAAAEPPTASEALTDAVAAE